jgi:hypothetical protein
MAPTRNTSNTPSNAEQRQPVHFPFLSICFDCLIVLESGDYWKRLFLFIGIPSILLVAGNTYFIEEKHHQHLEEHPPEFLPYEHMKIRSKVINNTNTHI